MSVKVTSFVPKAINGNKKGTENGMLKIAIKVTGQAKALAPVDGGLLRGSIMWKSYTEDGGNTKGDEISRPKKNQIAVGTNTEYSI